MKIEGDTRPTYILTRHLQAWILLGYWWCVSFRYRALFSYEPVNEDELRLEEGDEVIVLEKCDDGWFVGTSSRTHSFGTFPGNYVERVGYWRWVLGILVSGARDSFGQQQESWPLPLKTRNPLFLDLRQMRKILLTAITKRVPNKCFKNRVWQILILTKTIAGSGYEDKSLLIN